MRRNTRITAGRAEVLGDTPQTVREAITGIVALLAGERQDLRWVTLDQRGSEPDCARAVGAALGHNPLPIVVPCHRVLAVTGALHGFSAPGGIVTKRRMLQIERAPGFTQQALFA